MGQANLQAVTTNLQLYLQSAEPGAFGSGDSTSIIAVPSGITVPTNWTGLTCWDNTTNRELFTLMWTDVTQPSVTDPTGMSQLDVYSISVSYPISAVSWLPINAVQGISRPSATLTWACLVDSPYSVTNYLPAQ
jgi:hypothetical protein